MFQKLLNLAVPGNFSAKDRVVGEKTLHMRGTLRIICGDIICRVELIREAVSRGAALACSLQRFFGKSAEAGRLWEIQLFRHLNLH